MSKKPFHLAAVIINNGVSLHFFSCPVRRWSEEHQHETIKQMTRDEAEKEGWTFTTDIMFCEPNQDMAAVCPACSKKLKEAGEL
jgi:hypothetical protein